MVGKKSVFSSTAVWRYRWVHNYELFKRKRFKAKLVGKPVNRGRIHLGTQDSNFIEIVVFQPVQILGTIILSHYALVRHFSVADFF